MPGPSSYVASGNLINSFFLLVPAAGASYTANVPTITTAERTLTVPGLRVGDVVTINKPSHQTGLGIVNVRVSANDTLAITFMNVTAGNIAPAAETLLLQVDRPGYDNPLTQGPTGL